MINFKSTLPNILREIALLLIMLSPVFAQSGIYHTPYGYETMYAEREIEIEGFPCERIPRDPVEGDNVLIKFRTNKDSDSNYFVEYTVDGMKREPSKAEFDYEDSEGFYWTAEINGFNKGEIVDYKIVSYNQNSLIEQSQTFNFTCLGWDYIQDVTQITYSENTIYFKCNSTSQDVIPIVSFTFESDKKIKMQLSFNTIMGAGTKPPKNCNVNINENSIEVNCNDLTKIEATKKPFSFSVLNTENDKPILTEYDVPEHSSIGFLHDGNSKIFKVAAAFYSEDTEKFYGFGERYNAFNQRGNVLDNYVVNIWKDQGTKSYIPVPFYFTNNNYGLFINSYNYTQFDLDNKNENKCIVTTNFNRSNSGTIEYYILLGDNSKEIIESYVSITGKPEPIPVWTLGPWISANEWDKQSEIEAQLDSLKKYNIPNTVVVIEAWSDEETFYIFNDAQYELKDGSDSFELSDFTFTGRWPSPVEMIEDLHKDNMKLILWNIPVLKYNSVENRQRDNDEKYAIESDFVVKNPDGSPFRMPPSWFGNSLNLDFTNKFAAAWWMNKRRYLIDEMKIDGFKTDGGEFIWGRELVFSDGSRGYETRNKYPELYVQSYYDFIKSRNEDAIVFHRAGTFGAQNHPLAWNGDQNSSFPAFKEAIRSCINMSISGIPFVAYDIAGYHDETGLTSELYKRSLAQAAFSPIMQLHSAYGGDPEPSMERTPWNIAKLLNDKSCIDVYKKFANVRYNIIPYLYSEMKKSSESGLPLMSPLFIEYPGIEFPKENEFNYLLGNSLLVCPVTEPNVKSLDIMLPPGTWFDLWTGKEYEGNISIKTPDDFLPVFAKEGSIVPFNLNLDYTLGGDISNDLTKFSNLTFYIYPSEDIQCHFYDYTTSEEKLLRVTSNDKNLVLEVPEFASTVNFVVTNNFDNKEIQIEDIARVKDKEEFINSEESYFFNDENNSYYIKLKADDTGRKLVLHK
ncbi:MAG: glycoside hydrolase family 31 protein [Ignavibacteria bacterium]|jgi:alpha-glucosidase (family GH31 glycosyl hydrolase)